MKITPCCKSNRWHTSDSESSIRGRLFVRCEVCNQAINERELQYPEESNSIVMKDQPFYIQIEYANYNISRVDRFKTWLWKLVLPPHFRLTIKELKK